MWMKLILGMLNAHIETTEELRNCESSNPVLTSELYTIPSVPFCMLLHPTRSEIPHFYTPQVWGRKIDREILDFHIRTS